MLRRVQRVAAESRVEAFNWGGGHTDAPRRSQPRVAPMAVSPLIDPDHLEREAFKQGYAQGERAGAEAAAARGEAVLRRLEQTIQELHTLRSELVHKTERQVVQLALAMAKRIVHREISLDRELLTAMARVALNRLGVHTGATVRLHPDDYAATHTAQHPDHPNGAIQVVPDPTVRRGGCLIQSDFGLIDIGVDSQIHELTTVLFGRDDGADSLESAEALVGS
jgi:flagellar assembly protein FliH